MDQISWSSVFFYALCGIFVFYQQLHVRDFHGASKIFLALLQVSVLAGGATKIVYLIYYGWKIVWWAPLLIFPTGIAFTFLGLAIEYLIGKFALSLMGFIGWPVCGYKEVATENTARGVTLLNADSWASFHRSVVLTWLIITILSSKFA